MGLDATVDPFLSRYLQFLERYRSRTIIEGKIEQELVFAEGWNAALEAVSAAYSTRSYLLQEDIEEIHDGLAITVHRPSPPRNKE